MDKSFSRVAGRKKPFYIYNDGKAWHSSLIFLILRFKPLKITVCYWRDKHGHDFSVENFPTFTVDGAAGKHHIYGLPADEYQGLVKVSYFTCFTIVGSYEIRLLRNMNVRRFNSFTKTYDYGFPFHTIPSFPYFKRIKRTCSNKSGKKLHNHNTNMTQRRKEHIFQHKWSK